MRLRSCSFLLFMFACLFSALPRLRAESEDSNHVHDIYATRRAEMVAELRLRGIVDERVLDVMSTVPRHEFVPDAMRERAYTSSPLPIGYEQTISHPSIVAFMTEALKLKPHEKVLEIGTGSGYQAAILAKLVKSVYSIEIVPELAKSAEETLERLHFDNVKVKSGDGYRGWPEFGPFDAIIVTAAPPHLPQPLRAQLKEGGRLIVPVGKNDQMLQLHTKVNGKISVTDLIKVRFVPMTGEVERDFSKK